MACAPSGGNTQQLEFAVEVKALSPHQFTLGFLHTPPPPQYERMNLSSTQCGGFGVLFVPTKSGWVAKGRHAGLIQREIALLKGLAVGNVLCVVLRKRSLILELNGESLGALLEGILTTSPCAPACTIFGGISLGMLASGSAQRRRFEELNARRAHSTAKARDDALRAAASIQGVEGHAKDIEM